MKKLTHIFLKLSVAIFFLTSSINTNAQNVIGLNDTAFINKNITDNMMEVNMSKLGLKKATNAQVKKAATQMITDHTLMLNDLKKLAVKKKTGALMTAMKPMPEMPFENTTGKEFDKAWTAEMLAQHEAKLTELQGALQEQHSAGTKALINKALPKIKAHRDLLTRLNKTL